MKRWYRISVPINKQKSFNQYIEIQYGITFEDLREQMDRIEEEHGDQFEQLRIEPETHFEQYSDAEYTTYYVEGYREETDEEFEAILQAARDRQAEQEARDRKQYETLAKKFSKEK
jgi:hypothetical protein